MIIGIDEVGRGPWAGPLVVGAVILGEVTIDGLTDSKRLTKLRREAMAKQILHTAAAAALGWVEAHEIDEIGLSAALKLATRRALEQVHVPYHEIIIDGTVNFLEGTSRAPYVTTLKKADLLISAVSAASIIAKVARDDYMTQLSTRLPEYGFESHAGYGTAKHRAALERSGVTDEHRMSFAPVAAIAGKADAASSDAVMTSKEIGNTSESVCADWLVKNGFVIVERNWKTRFCEIDIIASKADAFYFIEVKHRKDDRQGGGLSAITSLKHRQMTFAATMYLSRRPGISGRLGAMTTGMDYRIIDELLLVD